MVGFGSVVEAHPERPALIAPDGTTATYGELGAGTNRVGHLLRSLASTGDSIAVALPNSQTLLEVYAAALQMGAYFVPVNWHLTGPEISYLLSDSAAKVFVAHERFGEAARAAADAAGLPAEARFSVGTILGFRPLEELAAAEPSTRPSEVRRGQPMFYTSGTTGRPKGIRKPLPDGDAGAIGVVIRPASANGSPSPEELVHLIGGPLYHAAPLAGAAGVLDAGSLLVLMDKWEAERCLGLIERHRVTHAPMVPTMFHRLLSLPEDVRRRADTSSLLSVTHAGAPCPIDVKRRMIEWWGSVINEYYSASEGGVSVAVTAEEWLRKPGTVGRPAPGGEVTIVDDDGKECAPGVPGTVYLTPLWEFEYHNDPAKTRSIWRDGKFTVGDIGYVDEDGYLFLCDRHADLILSGGVNIYPAEVEGVLVEHPSVGDVAVVGVPNDDWGEEVRAVVEPARNVAPTADLEAELVAFCRERLAAFKCPRRVDFVDELGRDPNGKVRKHRIRDRYWADQARKI